MKNVAGESGEKWIGEWSADGRKVECKVTRTVELNWRGFGRGFSTTMLVLPAGIYLPSSSSTPVLKPGG